MADRSLIPELPPGSIVVCDNLPAHKVAGIRQMPRRGRYGPALSSTLLARPQPDRTGLHQNQSAAPPRRARSFEAIVAVLKHILERFRPAECANYLRHSGYV